MNFYLYAAVGSLDVIYAHFLIGLWKRVLLSYLFSLYFVRHLRLEYLYSDDSDESNEEEYDKLESESGSAGTLSTRLGWLLLDLCLPLGVTLSADETCDGNGGSLAVPKVKNVSGAGTREGSCTKCTGSV